MQLTSGLSPGGSAPSWAAGRRSRIRDRHSGKALGVDDMFTADSARVVRFSENGTDDHLWQMPAR
ncbi:hypothetical protein [Streptomyces yanii]|uniref:Uncharacterized protein n=1 Tax=Streptomyces yanii TaxID=78510 RepID=A0ABV5RP54_9ACTN